LLNQIPLAALVKNKQFLSTKYNLIQLSSTDVLKNDLTEPNKKTLLLIGGVDYNNNGFKIDQTDHTINNNQITSNTEIEEWKYLPGTLSEIERIQSLLDKNQLLFNALSGSKATEENFKKLSGKSPSVLHIATHGFFKEKERHLKNKNELLLKSENPLTRSGLILAGANTITKNKLSTSSEDGVLTALEISNLNLTNTEIVILSACETGLGDIEGSEGVYGLQRAFKMAGVDLIVMSLWQVPDKETAEFMDLFYSKWLKENNVRTAFNNTQKIMQNKYKNEPYKWAAFVLFE